MDNVVKLKDGNTQSTSGTTSDVVKFLRVYADKLEKGELRPVHKAVLLMCEDRGDHFRIARAYCNATAVERAGIINLASQSTTDTE